MCHDIYRWRAHYNDGTFLDEEGHGFRDIDQKNLIALELIPNRPGLPVHCLRLSPDMRPIFFRRRQMTINILSEEEVGRYCVHCLGWQKTIKGTNVAQYAFIFEDGSVLHTDDFNAF